MAARPYLLVAAGLLLAASGCRTTGGQVSAERFGRNVAWLADDARKGRQTGSPELLASADYVATQFRRAGLRPGGDRGTYLQHFTVKGQRELVDGNELVIGNRSLKLAREWMPFQTAAEARVNGPLVFAGYGIQDEDGGWDDYAGLDVQDAVVVVLRKGPRSSRDEDGPYDEGAKRRHISFRSKINIAFRHGAAAVLVVNDPASYPPGSNGDRLVPYGTAGDRGPRATLPAAHLTAAAGSELLAAFGLDLAALQAGIDEAMAPDSRPIATAQARITIATRRPDIETVNVVGWLPGAEPGEHVVVGAHMDHLGQGRRGSSRARGESAGKIHNGADDNASGTAGLIEVAQLLGAAPGQLRRGVVFVAFSGEEWGLLGSAHYVDHPFRPIESTAAMLNMDMIGRSEDHFLSIEGVGTSPGFPELVEQVHRDLGLDFNLTLADRPGDDSDHASFFHQDVPVLMFFTGLHDDYHRPSDDSDKIQVKEGAAVARLAGELVRHIADARKRPPFVDPSPKQQQVAAGDSRPGGPPATGGYRIVFGSVPDMTYTKDDGMRVSGVRDGSPAAKAGLLAGDVIVALDGVTVRNLQDYATLLFSHQPGDEIMVTVRRDGAALDLKAVLEGRVGEG